MILLLDNYDSFVHNLARYFRLLGCPVDTVRNDQVTVQQVGQWIEAGQYRALVFSPGPCAPRQAGISLELIQAFYQSVPMLGVCLGHQAIAEALGASVIQGDRPIHGRADWVFHDQQAEFEDLPSPFRAARYHSLTVIEKGLPPQLMVTARLDDGTVMGIRHRELPIVGYQFHPESILTDHGLDLVAGFLRRARLPFVWPAQAVPQRSCRMPLACRPIGAETTQ